MNTITVERKPGHCRPAMAGLLVAAMALFSFSGPVPAAEMPGKTAQASGTALAPPDAAGKETRMQLKTGEGEEGRYIVEARRGRGGSSGSSGSSGRGRGRGGDSGGSGSSSRGSDDSGSGRSSGRSSSDDSSHSDDRGMHHRSDSQEARSLREDRLDRLDDDSTVRGGGLHR